MVKSAARMDRAILAQLNGVTRLLDQIEAACKLRRLVPHTIRSRHRWLKRHTSRRAAARAGVPLALAIPATLDYFFRL